MFNEYKLEPLRAYDINLTYDDEIVIEIPGYYAGEPLIRTLIYNGRKHAILVRNKYQNILLDDVHPEIRDGLYDSKEVTIVETDSLRSYKAVLSHKDVNKTTEKAYKLQDISFKYNPFPIMNGTFDTGSGKCSCCGKKKNIHMKIKSDPVEKARLVLCPECISENRYREKGIDLWPGIDEKIKNAPNAAEVLEGCPPFKHNGMLSGTWGMHCGTLSVFLGKLEPEDLYGMMWEEIEETLDNEMNLYKDAEAGMLFKRVDKGEVSAYLFRCAECEKHFCIFLEN